MSMIVCPICQKDDMIRKISSIIKEQTKVQETQGKISGGGVSIDTELNIGVETGGGTYKGRGYISSTLAITLAPPEIDLPPKMPPIFYVVIGLIGAVIITYIASLFFKNHQFFEIIVFAISAILIMGFIAPDEEKEKAAKIIKKYSEPWKELYYCFRDDIVFDPESKTFCPPSTASILKLLGAPEEEIKLVIKYT